jgi:cyclopropane fatty-acyl-phospholipid synthase-like methyltransferase
MGRRPDLQRFADLTYDDFRRLATDDSLTRYEKIGFPDDYRDGFEEAIFADIVRKLPALDHGRDGIVLDIGPGCSDLPRMIGERCGHAGHELLLVDSPEMLAQLPGAPHIRKYAAQFPNCPELLAGYAERVDAIVAYSVLHYVFPNSNVHSFLAAAVGLLAHGGSMLIGDIPNLSKRRRFFSSPAGHAHHREFTGSDDPPDVTCDVPAPGRIDDTVLLGLVSRVRAAGCDAYLVPQADGLPMANRREDLLIYRP